MRISLFREKENEEEEEVLRIDTEESKEENEGLDPIKDSLDPRKDRLDPRKDSLDPRKDSLDPIKDSLFAESPIDFKCYERLNFLESPIKAPS
jgi:hypothetical protein